MKILILSQYWYPENGVPQRRWSWLTEILTVAGHEVTVITPPPHYNRPDAAGSGDRLFAEDGVEIGLSGERIVRCAYLGASTSLTARALNQAVVSIGMIATAVRRKGVLQGYEPDLVIGTVPAIPTSWGTWIVARFLRVPYIIDLRDAWPELLYERDSWNAGTGRKSFRENVLSLGPVQMVSLVVERLMLLSYRKSNGMILTSDRLGRKLGADRRVCDYGMNKPIVTIRNVFSPESNRQEVDRVSRGRGTLNVLYAGTLGRAQKLSNALHAVRIAEDFGVKVNLRLVGAGATRNALKKQIEEEKLSVELLGRISANELASHYEWADTALVHLTDWEALKSAIPSKTFELMQLGIHISGVVAGETADIIEQTRAGDVVAPEDPHALAEMWVRLANSRRKLEIGEEPALWVKRQKEIHAKEVLLNLVSMVTSGKDR